MWLPSFLEDINMWITEIKLLGEYSQKEILEVINNDINEFVYEMGNFIGKEFIRSKIAF